MTVRPRRQAAPSWSAPFNGSPAYRAGLRPGDAIVEVNGKKTDGLDTTAIADLLKGPRGTHVQVTRRRDGVDQADHGRYHPRRNPAPQRVGSLLAEARHRVCPGEPVQGEHQQRTGRQPEEAGREQISRAWFWTCARIRAGCLNEGIEVAGHFLKKNQVVVSHRGRVAAEQELHGAQRQRRQGISGGGGGESPLGFGGGDRFRRACRITIAPGFWARPRSAKAWCRTVFPLSENTGLALTTMHYYTPSGRLIQRDYSNISFLDYYYQQATDQKNMADVKMTDSGRTVYGGGGITPDEKYDAAKLNKFQIEMLRNFALLQFLREVLRTAGRIPSCPRAGSRTKHWSTISTQFLMTNDVQFTEAEFTENHQWVKEQLKQEMYITAFNCRRIRSRAASSRIRKSPRPWMRCRRLSSCLITARR